MTYPNENIFIFYFFIKKFFIFLFLLVDVICKPTHPPPSFSRWG